jgi:hypothetical protein
MLVAAAPVDQGSDVAVDASTTETYFLCGGDSEFSKAIHSLRTRTLAVYWLSTLPSR